MQSLNNYRAIPSALKSQQIVHYFQSDTIILNHPVTWSRIEVLLVAFIRRYAGALVWLKGIIYTPENDHPLLIQGGAGCLYPTIRLAARETDDGLGRLVLISEGPIAALKEALEVDLQNLDYQIKFVLN